MRGALTAAGRDPRRRVRRLLSLCLTGVLSVVYLWVGLSAHPPAVLSRLPDAATHSVGYGVLSWAAVASTLAWRMPFPWALAGGYSLGHGALLELLQSTTASRLAEWRDLMWDGVGTATALGAAAALRRRRCGS
ncbi:MAG: hypothetical protein HXY19_03635 [Thermoanaerobaculaceae bacterium]|nr:hypothetical protein [Thermoanaerobaculaceae bacterium]